MGLLYGIFLLAAARIAATSPCPFLDTSGTVISSFTETGTHKLACASGNIAEYGSGSTSFNFFSCAANGDWYGLSCDGTVLAVGAQLNVSCPTEPEVLSCPFRGSGQGVIPAVRVVDGAQVRSCGDGELLKVEGVSDSIGFTSATCMDGAWAVFNCEGSLEVIEGPLEAHCDNEPGTGGPTCTHDIYKTSLCPGPSFTCSEQDGFTYSSDSTTASLTCGPGQYVFFKTTANQGGPVPMEYFSWYEIICTEGKWNLTYSEEGVVITNTALAGAVCFSASGQITPLPTTECTSFVAAQIETPGIVCAEMTEANGKLSCPTGFYLLAVGDGAGPSERGFLYFDSADRDPTTNEYHFALSDRNMTTSELFTNVGENLKVGCSTYHFQS